MVFWDKTMVPYNGDFIMVYCGIFTKVYLLRNIYQGIFTMI